MLTALEQQYQLTPIMQQLQAPLCDMGESLVKLFMPLAR
jgi:hypothetical protein